VTAAVNIPDAAIAAGWHEFRYPRPAIDEPSEAFQRGLRAAAPLILAAELERLAKKFEGHARACKNLGFTEFSEGRAEALTVAKEELLRLVAELRGESR
jgi:hypothetical protein